MRFDITPLDDLVDAQTVIRLVEATPRSRVTIRVETDDAFGRRWSSSALFLAREDGTIDLTEDAPIQGSYHTKDPMGLLSTLAPVGKDATSVFATLDAEDLQLTFSAGERDQVETSVLVVRRLQAAGVGRFAVEDGDVHGTLFVPARPEPTGAVLVVPGAMHPRVAALPYAAVLASAGYLTLCLDPLSNAEGQFVEVPLERLRDAAALLRSHPRCSGRVAGLGIEKGGEAVLAAAGNLPDLALDALIVVAPTCVVWQASGPGKPPTTSSWSVGGQALPYVPVRAAGGKLLRLGKKEGGAVAQLGAHMDALKDVEAFKRAALPVEKIAGPILLLAGADDQQWPSAEMAELIYRARRASHCHEGDQKLSHNKVGRLIRFPHLPTTVSRYYDPATGTGWVLGGTPEGNQHADEVSWAKVREFLGLHLGGAADAADTGGTDAAPPAAPAPAGPDQDDEDRRPTAALAVHEPPEDDDPHAGETDADDGDHDDEDDLPPVVMEAAVVSDEPEHPGSFT